MMLVFISLLCCLFVTSSNGLTYYQINEKLSYIEDRINAESKFRRNDFNTLYNEISSVKEMLQTLFEKNGESKYIKPISQENDDISKKLDEKFNRLLAGFKEEKATNSRVRRKTQELQQQVSDLKTFTDKNSEGHVNMMKGLEKLTKQNKKIQNNLNSMKNVITKFENWSDNFTELYKNYQNVEEGKLEKIETGTEMIREIAEGLRQSQEKCFLNSENIYNATNRLNDNVDLLKNYVRRRPSCADLYNEGIKVNGIYELSIGENKPFSVYCDMETDNGGWTVFQRRQDGSVDFFRNWEEYKAGFGDLNGEFWLGNKYLNLLTDDNKQHELRIDLEDFDGNRAYAKYSSFKIQSEKMEYKLEVSGYTGDAGDSLVTSDKDRHIHDKMKFSTKDNDNDSSSNNCASSFHGAWWFNYCFSSHLNGLYSQQARCTIEWRCIIWKTWKGSQTSMKLTEMKLR